MVGFWLIRGEIRAFERGIFFWASSHGCLHGRLFDLKRVLLGWKQPRAQLLWKTGLKKEMKEEKMGLSLRFVYLLFPSLSSSFFNGCIFPFYELISFSRVLDVV